MKLGKLRIYFGKRNSWTDFETLIAERELSALDKQRIVDYLSGKYSFVRKRKERKSRHTPEELDRLIERVRELNSPKIDGETTL